MLKSLFQKLYKLITWYMKFVFFMIGFMGIIILSMVFADLVGMSGDYLSILGHENFWEDANAFAVGDQSSAELQDKYGESFKNLSEQAFWMFYPSEKTITFRMNMKLALGGSLREDLFIMIFMYFIFHYALRLMASLFCGANDISRSFFSSSSWGQRISFLLSAGIVWAISYLNAYLDQGRLNLELFDLATLYFVLSYTSALWFLAIKYAIDCFYLREGINPHRIFKDDLWAMGIAFVLLVFYGNSHLSILSEIVAGVAPFLIFKIMLRYRPSLEKEEECPEESFSSETYDGVLGFCSLIFMIVLLCRLVFVGAMLTDSLHGYNYVRHNVWSERIWSSYLEEKYEPGYEKYLGELANTDEKEHKNTLAAFYAWQGNRAQAEFFAKNALAETPRRVNLLLQGMKPKQVEARMK